VQAQVCGYSEDSSVPASSGCGHCSISNGEAREHCTICACEVREHCGPGPCNSNGEGSAHKPVADLAEEEVVEDLDGSATSACVAVGVDGPDPAEEEVVEDLDSVAVDDPVDDEEEVVLDLDGFAAGTKSLARVSAANDVKTMKI
jgi:hypothetical protein